MLKSFFLFVLLFSSISFFSQEIQNSEVLLQQKINNATNDSIRVLYLFELTIKVEKRNIKEGRTLMLKVLDLVDKNEKPSNYLLERKSKAYAVLGKYERREGNYKEALNYCLKSLELAKKTNDAYRIRSAYQSLGLVYINLKEYTTSKNYFKKAIKIAMSSNDSAKTSSAYNVLSTACFYNKEIDSSLFYSYKAKDYCTIPIQKAKVNNNIATFLYTQNKIPKVISIYKENLKIFRDNKHNTFETVTLRNLAKVHSDIGKQREALTYINQAFELSKQRGITYTLPEIFLLRSLILERSNKYDEALRNYKSYKAYSDSIFDIKKLKEIKELELNHKFEQEKQILLHNTENQKKKKQFYITLFISSIIGFLLLTFLYFKSKKLSKEQTKKQLLEKELLSEKLKSSDYKTKRVIADNKMRLQFKQELIEKLKILKKNIDIKNSDFQSFINDLQLQINTESKLDSISEMIDSFDTIFDEKLRSQYPNLTKSEREICTLMRLNLSLKEIMVIRNSTMDSIKSSRYRIRKKMNIPKEKNTEVFIQQLFFND